MDKSAMSFFYNATGDVQNLGGTTLGDHNLENLYKRDSQFDYSVKQIGNIAGAYRDPAKYFEDKQKALKTAGEQAAVVYRSEFQKLVKGLIPAATAHARAKKLADTYAELLKADVETDYPSNLNDLSLQLHYNTSQQNAGTGFIMPSTSTGVAGVGHKKHRKSRK